MTFAHVLGAAGRFMIRAGVLVLLFVGYQLWGTGIHTSQAQDDLGRQFRQQQAEVAGLSGNDGSAGTLPSDDTSGSDPADPTTTGPTATIAPPTPAGALPPPAPGQSIGQITIPKIGADFYMVEGVELRWLQDGPGHFPGTPLPGQAGNAAVAGHRTTYKAPFNRIDELDPGDPITITTLQGTFNYEVLPQPPESGDAPSGHRIVSPSAVEILVDKGDNRLTLMACNPKYSAAQRIVVEAKLVGNPAPTTAQLETRPSDQRQDQSALDALGKTGLAGGDRSARPPAVAWSLLAIAIWFGAWWLARHWRRVPAYAIALPFFAVVLYAAFENITRLLPGAF